MARPRRIGFADLPLSWKLLLPSVGLIVMLGTAGGFLVVRDLAVRSQAALDLELSQRAFETRSIVRDYEASLIESANFASNLEGIVPALKEGDQTEAADLLQSVVALKPDLELLAATDLNGASIAEFTRSAPGESPNLTEKNAFEQHSILARALSDQQGGKFADFVSVQDRNLLAIAAPVCTQADICTPVGAVIVGIGMDRVAGEVLTRLGSRAAVTFFDQSGRPVASAGKAAPIRLPKVDIKDPVRVNEKKGSSRVGTFYAPLHIRDHQVGSVGISIPIDRATSSVRRAGFGLGLILLTTMVGIAAIGILMSRLILRQVRALAETNRALGRGDLSARAELGWRDEIGELATRFNEMAEQLEATHQTLELRVAQRTEEIERLLRERTEFFASVSHELRTPLAVIMRHAEMLLDEGYGKNGRWRADAGSALKDSGGQLSRLIDDILELAEAEAGGLDVDLQPVNLSRFFEETRRTIEPLARSAGLTASVRLPPNLPLAKADPQRLRQIVLNLVDNAVKYTPDGGSVEITARTRGDVVEISVADTGVGLPPDCGNQIFQPFFRVKGISPQRGQSSSGLGLAVVKRLVEAHGGRVSYKSRQEEGTTFVFTLPIVREVRSVTVARVGSDEHAIES